MPLPNTRMIDPRFEAHYRPIANRQMTARCQIERPATQPVWDDEAGRDVLPQPTLVYEGPCRYQYQSASGQPVVADTPTPLADVRITVPADGIEYRADDLVTVTIADTNPDLVGRALVVRGVSGSSISWQRDLTCQLRQPTTR